MYDKPAAVLSVSLAAVENFREVMSVSNYTDEQQSFIDGIEFAIDNGLEISQEEYEEYCRLTNKTDF